MRIDVNTVLKGHLLYHKLLYVYNVNEEIWGAECWKLALRD